VSKIKDKYKNINGVLYKKCTKHNLYFPEEDEWFPCTKEYFYKVNTNKTDGLFPYCKKCDIARAAEWAQNNRDQWRYLQREHQKKPERKQYHREIESERRQNGKVKEWIKNNPDKLKEYIANHQSHNITKKEWEYCKQYFNYECAYCGLPLSEHYRKYKGERIKSDFHKEHVDHNGTNDLSNCIPSCTSCNSQKWKFELDTFYNESNGNYTQERYDKIKQWLNEDYKVLKD
jgi:hypothetical protein